MRSTRLPTAALALIAIAAGVVLAGPSQAAAKPCTAYADPAGDTATGSLNTPAGATPAIPLADGHLDIAAFGLGATADSLIGFIKVAALGDAPETGIGDQFTFNFTLDGKVYEVFKSRLPGPLETIATEAFYREGVRVDGTVSDATDVPVKATYDTASNTVVLAVTFADLDTVTKTKTAGKALTKLGARARADDLAQTMTYDFAAADAASYKGTVCAVPAGGAAPAPAASASASAAPSAAPSASASSAPSASAAPSGSAAPKPSATPAPKPSPKPSAAPKKNPGCGTTTAAPKPSSSASASAAASASGSANPATSGSAAASASALRAQALPTTNGNATGVSLRVSATEVTACNTPTLSGQVTDVQGRAMPDVDVTLSARAFDARAYTEFATVRTNSTGQFQLSVRPTVHISYAAAAGNAKSAAVPVRVHTRVVIESPKQDTGVASPVTLRGRIVPAFSKAAIELGYTVNGRYAVLGRTTTDGQGYWVVTGRPARGKRTFSVTTPERDGNLAGKQTITLTVQ